MEDRELILVRSDVIRHSGVCIYDGLDDAVHENAGCQEHQPDAVELLLGHPWLPLCPHNRRGVHTQVTRLLLGRILSAYLSFRDPWEMLSDGDFANVEIMIGTNQDEGERVI